MSALPPKNFRHCFLAEKVCRMQDFTPGLVGLEPILLTTSPQPSPNALYYLVSIFSVPRSGAPRVALDV